jgi:hypothetical protein
VGKSPDQCTGGCQRPLGANPFRVGHQTSTPRWQRARQKLMATPGRSHPLRADHPPRGVGVISSQCSLARQKRQELQSCLLIDNRDKSPRTSKCLIRSLGSSQASYRRARTATRLSTSGQPIDRCERSPPPSRRLENTSAWACEGRIIAAAPDSDFRRDRRQAVFLFQWPADMYRSHTLDATHVPCFVIGCGALGLLG